jgi:glutathione S-transferase
MLTLYYKPNCVFCRRVLAVIDRLGIEVELRNIEENSQYADALIAHGGKRQVPYLVDQTQAVSLYESDAIVAHLQKHYENGAVVARRPKVHVGGSVCLACEG